MNTTPTYVRIPPWENYAVDIMVEYMQCVDEGLDVERYKTLIEEISKLPIEEEREKMADAMFSLIQKLPVRGDFKYNEPSDYETIKSLCPESVELPAVDRQKLFEKIYGAWMGRICGCLLGKPVEGMRMAQMDSVLKETGNYPVSRYLLKSDMTEEVCEKCPYNLLGRVYADDVEFAPTDDDTNYTALSQLLVEKHGRDFTPDNVGEVWLSTQPKEAYCTAERIAYKNLMLGFEPPRSATYKNVYREWIGAQIRVDYYGYINPGDPEAAAEMAFRDACISHTKNGIYGAMWAAACIAAAAATDDAVRILRAGMSQIPTTSRLYERLDRIIKRYQDGVSEKEAFDDIRNTYPSDHPHTWVHTIPNAEIVAYALLYGNGDYGRSICLAVGAGKDTDCNGATVGSIVGMMKGIGAIGEEWTKATNGKLATQIIGVGDLVIEEAAKKTMEHLKK